MKNGLKVGVLSPNRIQIKMDATNQRKTAIYLSIESLRKELLELENIFGLTPKGLKMIKNKGLEQNKKSALDRIFDQDV